MIRNVSLDHLARLLCQGYHPVLGTLAEPHYQFPLLGVHVVQRQIAQLIPSYAGGVQDLKYDPVPVAVGCRKIAHLQELSHFSLGEDVPREPFGDSGEQHEIRRVAEDLASSKEIPKKDLEYRQQIPLVVR